MPLNFSTKVCTDAVASLKEAAIPRNEDIIAPFACALNVYECRLACLQRLADSNDLSTMYSLLRDKIADIYLDAANESFKRSRSSRDALFHAKALVSLSVDTIRSPETLYAPLQIAFDELGLDKDDRSCVIGFLVHSNFTFCRTILDEYLQSYRMNRREKVSSARKGKMTKAQLRRQQLQMRRIKLSGPPDEVVDSAGNLLGFLGGALKSFVGHLSKELRKDLAAEKKASEAKPWWKANFLVTEPLLFGTWDGVFTAVVINLIGVIVFMRTGWMVANAGIGQAIGVLLTCMLVALVPVLSAIGICERCQIQSGGVYFMVSHILGAQIGGAVGVMYAVGQALSVSMVAVGFGESLAHVMGTENVWLVRLFAIVVTLALVAINVMGVKWVIKMQIILLAILALGLLDFFLGSFTHGGQTDELKSNVTGFSGYNWRNNTGTDYMPTSENFFTVFGVFFSTFTGVLSGVNMSGDLKDPAKSIPIGEFAGLVASTGFMIIFVLVLGATCTRVGLRFDGMIAEQVSLLGVPFLLGLYMSSMSSILGSLYGAPRVLQSIAAEDVIPGLKRLEAGKGPNKIPVLAIAVTTVFAVVFILAGHLNSLAKLSTLPYLITYSFVNYAYVSLAMTYDVQQQRETRDVPSYGSTDKLRAYAAGQSQDDVDQLFAAERQKFKPSQGPESVVADEVDRPGIDANIIHQPRSWYSVLCNRYVAMVGTVVNIVILFLINWIAAIIHLALLGLLYFYIGRANPAAFTGISEFSLNEMFRVVFNKFSNELTGRQQMIVTPGPPSLDSTKERLTDANTDYSNRQQYHAARSEHMLLHD